MNWYKVTIQETWENKCVHVQWADTPRDDADGAGDEETAAVWEEKPQ